MISLKVNEFNELQNFIEFVVTLIPVKQSIINAS